MSPASRARHGHRFLLPPAAAPRAKPGEAGSGTGCLERRRDVLDRLLLCRAYALPSLAVSLGDLLGDSKHEAPVVIALFGGSRVFQQRSRVSKMVESLLPELL